MQKPQQRPVGIQSTQPHVISFAFICIIPQSRPIHTQTVKGDSELASLNKPPKLIKTREPRSRSRTETEVCESSNAFTISHDSYQGDKDIMFLPSLCVGKGIGMFMCVVQSEG